MGNILGHLNADKLPNGNEKTSILAQLSKAPPLASDSYYCDSSQLIEMVWYQLPRMRERLAAIPQTIQDGKENLPPFKMAVINVTQLFNNPTKFMDEVSQKLALDTYLNKELVHPRSKEKYDSEQDNFSCSILDAFAAEMYRKYHLVCGTLQVKNNKTDAKEFLLACFPSDITKNEDGKWYAKKREGAVAQFFANAIAQGFISEKALDDNANPLGSTPHQIEATLKQLKAEGIKPILPHPIIETHERDRPR